MESNGSKSSQIGNKKYCIAVDGSEYSDWAFELILNELYFKGDKILVFHIAHPGKLSEIAYEYQPDTVISKYKTKLTTKLLPTEFVVIKQDREKAISHALIQVNKQAIYFGCTVLVIGYHGHKENKNLNETTKGINYITNNINLPTIVVKEYISRSTKETGIFTWTAAIEQAQTRSWKAFEFSLNYIDVKKDKLIAVHVKFPGEDSTAEQLKEFFENTCLERGIVNYEFKLIEKEKNKEVAAHLCEFVNFNNNEVIDFMVIGHNPNKSNGPLEEVIKNAQTNILFYK